MEYDMAEGGEKEGGAGRKNRLFSKDSKEGGLLNVISIDYFGRNEKLTETSKFWVFFGFYMAALIIAASMLFASIAEEAKVNSDIPPPLASLEAQFGPGSPQVCEHYFCTLSPTIFPTHNPTGRPTPKPTKAPTKFPTTAEPTRFPTVSPTNAPTDFPTASPTSSPTRTPTKAPVLPTPSPVFFPGAGRSGN